MQDIWIDLLKNIVSLSLTDYFLTVLHHGVRDIAVRAQGGTEVDLEKDAIDQDLNLQVLTLLRMAIVDGSFKTFFGIFDNT